MPSPHIDIDIELPLEHSLKLSEWHCPFCSFLLNQHHKRYKGKLIGSEDPHIFAVAERAWQDMLHHHQHQNIILSGDRHSGKTFNANQIVQHLCYIARVSILTHSYSLYCPFRIPWFSFQFFPSSLDITIAHFPKERVGSSSVTMRAFVLPTDCEEIMGIGQVFTFRFA